MTAGEVYFCDFPRTELTGTDERPAVLLAKVFGGDFICCMVTTVKPKSFDPHVEITPQDMEDGAMVRYPSYIRPVRIATITPRIFGKRLGKIKPDTLAKVYDILHQKLSLNA